MVRAGWDRTEQKVLQKPSNRKIGMCANRICCDDPPATMIAYVWATYGFSGGPQHIGCDKVTLTRSALAGGGWKWTGNASSSVWNNCIEESTFAIEVRCDQSPKSARDRCTSAMRVLINGSLVSGGAQCCCDPPCMSDFTWAADADTTPIHMLVDGSCSPDNWDDSSLVTFGMWVYAADEFGTICCHPNVEPPWDQYTSGPCNGAGSEWESGPCGTCQSLKAGRSTWRLEGVGYGNGCSKWVRDIQPIEWDNSCHWEYSDSSCNTLADWSIAVDISITSDDILATVTFAKDGESSFSVDFALDISALSKPINCEAEWVLDFVGTDGDSASDPFLANHAWDSNVTFVWNPRASDTF